MKDHIVRLTDEARAVLLGLIRAGTRSVREVRRVQVLLKSDAGLTDAVIAEHVGLSTRAIGQIRKRFCQGGWERAVFEADRPGAPPRFTVKQQQQVIALACSTPPDGRTRWTLELLCSEAVARGFVPSLSTSEVSLWLHEHDLKPWRKKVGVFHSLPTSFGNAWKMY
jgi:transposase